MNTLRDDLNDLALKAIEVKEEAYSTMHDADDAEGLFIELLEEAIWDTVYKIKQGLEKYTE